MSRNRFLVTTVLAVCMTYGAPVVAEDIEETIDADASGTVVISNVSGEIEVYGWDRNEVRVHGDIGDDVEAFVLERDGNRVIVKVILPDRHRHSNDMDAELEIQIPRKSDLEINTVSADVTVSDVEGSRRLQTVSGDVETDVFKDDVEAKSVSGDIVVVGRNEAALVTVRTVSGDAL